MCRLFWMSSLSMECSQAVHPCWMAGAPCSSRAGMCTLSAFSARWHALHLLVSCHQHVIACCFRCTYDGDLVEGRLHGRGKLTFPDGMTYEGDFDNNTISGQGVGRGADACMA